MIVEIYRLTCQFMKIFNFCSFLKVFVNNEKPTYFNARSSPAGSLRGVSIDKVDKKDVSISLVQLDIL